MSWVLVPTKSSSKAASLWDSIHNNRLDIQSHLPSALRQFATNDQLLRVNISFFNSMQALIMSGPCDITHCPVHMPHLSPAA